MKLSAKSGLVPLLLASAVFWADTGQARAEILLTLSGGAPTNNLNGTFTYTYDVYLTGGYQLNQAGGGGNTANLFTMYDIQGYVPGSATSSAAGFSQSGVSEQLVGLTPITQAPVDDPNILNATFKYTSPTPTVNPIGNPDLLLGTVSFLSTDGVYANSAVMYSAAAQKYVPGSPANGDLANDTSLVIGPVAVMPIPGPPSIVMLGSGLPLLGAAFLRWRRRLLSLA
jgi:hypothetical protein